MEVHGDLQWMSHGPPSVVGATGTGGQAVPGGGGGMGSRHGGEWGVGTGHGGEWGVGTGVSGDEWPRRKS